MTTVEDDIVGASETAGGEDREDWIDWDELADNSVAVLCSVIAIEPSENFGNGEVEPVRARIIVLTGDKAGTVYPNERILKKGIRMKLTEPGMNVVGRLARYGQRRNIGLNDERDGDIDLAKRALKKFGKVETAPITTETANAKANSKKANGGTAVADDDEPPF